MIKLTNLIPYKIIKEIQNVNLSLIDKKLKGRVKKLLTQTYNIDNEIISLGDSIVNKKILNKQPSKKIFS